MAKPKLELDCCGDGCGCAHNNASSADQNKKLKLYFCPKCKSHDVGYIFTLKNIFGLMPKMKCKKCGFEATGFPILITSEKMLKKNLKSKSVNRKKR